mgnify:CR=1 FL=1
MSVQLIRLNLKDGEPGEYILVPVYDRRDEIQDILTLAVMAFVLCVATGYVLAGLDRCFTSRKLKLSTSKLKKVMKRLHQGNAKPGEECEFQHSHIPPNTIAAVVKRVLLSGQCPSRLTLNFSCSNISDKGVRLLGEALQSGRCPKDLCLNLSGIKTTVDGFIKILNRDREPGNLFGDQYALALGKALQSGRCPSGLSLYLVLTSMSDVGFEFIAKALMAGNCPLGLGLYIGLNDLTDRSCAMLAAALQSGKCPARLRIGLQNCHFTNVGLGKLITAYKSGKCPPGLILILDRVCETLAEELIQTVNSGVCKYGTRIFMEIKQKKYMLGGVNDRNLRVSLHAILTMLGGYKAKTTQHKASSFSLLSIDLINVISGFLYGNFSAHRILHKKKIFFETYIHNHSKFTACFSHRYRAVHQKVRRYFDTQYGLSLWRTNQQGSTTSGRLKRATKISSCSILALKSMR